jgi:hypothetical protein
VGLFIFAIRCLGFFHIFLRRVPAIFSSHVGGQFGFELLDPGAHDILAVVQNLSDTGLDAFTNSLLPCMKVDKFHP